ncbi:hypothetical protein VST7929_02517 [Vibrio stylophorae]|uniref:Transcriptional regulator n=1 Tax=Vibrio stylophorae TaxID=659351 RepID=A0ABM8ZW92_9VIBR|nr:metalloregulator ArsR/SmtB family transcription factor [Vibrio stylophorae]CAH0534573.1 hypothetical protein VST7929_02517 [Vibrio stylophorae]
MKTPEKILHSLKRDGDQTAQQLGERYAMTAMGARQHLQKLVHQGLVEGYDVKVAVGRPQRRWRLTAKSHEQFDNRHGDLSIQLLSAVQEHFGSDGLERVIHSREQQTLARYRQLLDLSQPLHDLLIAIAKIRSDEGYMAHVESHPQQGYLLIERHCPLLDAAQHCQQLCRSELSLLEQLLSPLYQVHRESLISQGQRVCCYHIHTN